MALLDLTTDLKSLRYGRDRIGGGDSREPFITKSIDSTPGDTGGPDFLLRANSLQHIGDDTSRMFDFLKSPKGLQFIAKQNLLSRTAVRAQGSSGPINDGIYLPTSTLAQVATNAAGGHLLKQGINPFANTKATDVNTGIGILDTILNSPLPLSAPFYVKRVTNNQSKEENRLVELSKYKLGIASSSNNSSFLDQILSGTGVGGFLGNLGGGIVNNLLAISPSAGQKFNNISLNDDEIIRYDGGPGSALGVGQTSLKRTTFTQKNNFPDNTKVYNYSQLVEASDLAQASRGATLRDFRTILSPSSTNSVISTSLDYQTKNQDIRVNQGIPGRRNKNLSNYNFSANGDLTPLDKLNAFPIYSSTNVITTKDNIKNDLVKFRIGILDNNADNPEGLKTYIHFRAFIDSFSDTYGAEWGEEKFMGRGEKFYRYGGFNRNIEMSWTVAAQSLPELIPMYQKLNFLASTLAPDYSYNGYMQGNIAYLTFGGYCYEQPGIITGMTLSVPEQSTYEIDIDSGQGRDGGINTKELPHIIKVSGFQFIPIHDFVPRIQQNDYDGEKFGDASLISKWGKERYIALENKNGSNYTGENGQNTFIKPSSTTQQSTNNQGDTLTEEAKGI